MSLLLLPRVLETRPGQIFSSEKICTFSTPTVEFVFSAFGSSLKISTFPIYIFPPYIFLK